MALGIYDQITLAEAQLRRNKARDLLTNGLQRLGYTKEEKTGHVFRSMASTLLNEQGWNRDAIERQLAHAERNNICCCVTHPK